MKSLRLVCALSTALMMLCAGEALGQRVQFPTRLPATDAVRVASTQAAAAPSGVPETSPQVEVAEEPPTPASPQGESVAEVAQAPQVMVPEVMLPEAMVADPCFPATTVVPYVPEPACWDHRWQFYGDFLWIKAKSAEVPYAVPVSGATVPLQIGPVATVNPELSPGFRVGMNYALGFPSRVGVSYTRFESDATDALTVDQPSEIEPLVLHPGADDPLVVFLDAEAGRGIDFQLIDADYRALLVCQEDYTVEYLIGGRYARLDQDFHATFFNGGTVDQLDTEIGFDGGGIRLGLEAERRSPVFGLLAYGRVGASFLAGRFSASYSQVENSRGTLVDTGFEADRVVPILDIELGVGWTGPWEHLRLTGGYMLSAWYNAVTTGELIQAVQTNSFVGLSNSFTFDGLVARAELRF